MRAPAARASGRGAPRALRKEEEKEESARKRGREGWQGWDDYARFYDWENARTLGRRDVAFWQALARRADGPILELGSGTGRVTLPVGRVARHPLVGIDRSAAMLARARRRLQRAHTMEHVSLVRGDIRALPFGARLPFHLVMAPYGVLQSLVRESDLSAALRSIADVLAPGGLLGIDLVPDLPRWSEYRFRVRLRGFRRASRSHVTLIESVRQDRRRRVTIFDQVFVERCGALRSRHAFSLAFRTLSIPQMRRRLEHAGLSVEAVLGDYDGRPWDPRADVWCMLARKKGTDGTDRTDREDRRDGIPSLPVVESGRFSSLSGVLTCPAIPSGIPSSTRKGRLTPSGAGSLHASSKN